MKRKMLLSWFLSGLLLIALLWLSGCLASSFKPSTEQETSRSKVSERGKPKWQVEVISSRGYLDEWAVYHVVGEVQNSTGRRVKSVRINAIFYDQQARQIDTGFAYLDPPQLEANQRSSFDVTNRSRSASSAISSYKLEVSYEID